MLLGLVIVVGQVFAILEGPVIRPINLRADGSCWIRSLYLSLIPIRTRGAPVTVRRGRGVGGAMLGTLRAGRRLRRSERVEGVRVGRRVGARVGAPLMLFEGSFLPDVDEPAFFESFQDI